MEEQVDKLLDESRNSNLGGGRDSHCERGSSPSVSDMEGLSPISPYPRNKLTNHFTMINTELDLPDQLKKIKTDKTTKILGMKQKKSNMLILDRSPKKQVSTANSFN
jgi:hypothetical protein